MTKKILIVLFSVMVCGCSFSGPEVTHIEARVVPPTTVAEPGEHPLGLGGWRLVNRSVIWRDGILYIPQRASSAVPLPLLVWLHGGGGSSNDIKRLFPMAEEQGVAVLALDARHNTWDGIDSPFGPDVLFMDAALRHTFERVAIDPQRIALGGLSDGAAYALALGRTNGDLFTHLIAVAPGQLTPPAPPAGKPRILVAHGRQDNVYSVESSRRFVVPRLQQDGYEVTYLEFDGPHSVPEPVGRNIIEWLAH